MTDEKEKICIRNCIPNLKEHSHIKITEQQPKSKIKTLIKHKHPQKTIGNLSFIDKDGIKLNLAFSASTELKTSTEDYLDETKWLCYRITSDLWLSILKNDHNKAFFYISGHRNVTHIRKNDLNHVPNRILGILKALKKVNHEY